MTPSTKLLLALTLVACLGTAAGTAADQPSTLTNGAWYLALDAEPFGLPPGSFLPGLAIFNPNGTLQVIDGGDFGGAPFLTRDSAQFGSWRWNDGKIEAVSLFLQADSLSGDVVAWQRVELTLTPVGMGRIAGTANVFGLACDLEAAFPVFGCPDPIASADSFLALPPFDIPIELSRLVPIHLTD